MKIPTKSIGVGQYQHDINQGLLESALDNVVEDCVNRVGVELNTASPSAAGSCGRHQHGDCKEHRGVQRGKGSIQKTK